MQSLLSSPKHVKPDHMQVLKLQQLQYEIHSWKRLMEYMSEENIHYKNRLSEILKDKFDKNILEEVDSFQNRFIRQDELMWLLRHDHAEVKKMLLQEIFNDQKMNKKIDHKVSNLRKNMNAAEKQFGILKSEFNHFLIENIL